MDTLKFEGTLEIDQNRGVIYFHSIHGMSLLRICQLPTPIPNPLTLKRIPFSSKQSVDSIRLLDISFKVPQADWNPCTCGPHGEVNSACPVHEIKEL